MTIGRVAVVGLGLIGGSLAAALRGAGAVVWGLDTNPIARDAARQLGLVDETVDDLSMVVTGADVVLLCVPAATVLRILGEVDRLAPRSAIILDTASVKAAVTKAMGNLPGGARAIGGHPLAGKETSGPAAAEPDLFHDHPFILTPSDLTLPSTLDRAADVARAVGASPYVMPANRHDELLARTSHLPQLLSTTLALRSVNVDRVCVGPGLRDMIRLAGSDPCMWRDILLLNGQNVVAEANEYIAELRLLVAQVEAGDAAGIESFLRAGQGASRVLRGVAA